MPSGCCDYEEPVTPFTFQSEWGITQDYEFECKNCYYWFAKEARSPVLGSPHHTTKASS